MRYIQKGQEPQSFANWKAQEDDNWKPTYADLRGQIKSDIHDSLLKEQGYTCCYCGMRIAKNISHIEHLQPQNEKAPEIPKDNALAIDYANLLVSCGFSENSKMSDQNYKNVLHCLHHCGCKRGNESLAVTPLQTDCAEFFRYTGAGEMRPMADSDKKQAAFEAIQTLNLNHGNLMAARREAIDGVLQGLEELTKSDIEMLIQSYEQPNQQAFSFAIAYTLRQYL
jgi:uncharacterized protein (TIGR02646 family)